MSLGATSSNKEVKKELSPEELVSIQEQENKRVAFQVQLAEIENKRLASDRLKEQEAIVAVKAIEIAEKAEAERLAKEKEKRLAEEKKRVEKERLAEEKLAKEAADKKISQAPQIAKSTGGSSTPTVQTASKAPAPAQSKAPGPAPVVNQTSGFNFNGHHFPLGSFSGGGKVPQETNRVYQWTDKPDHFLVERVSPAGRAITGVGIGTKIVINGSTYTVTNMERNIPNNDAAVDYLYKHNATITFQTCETTRGANGKSHVRFWYAR